MSIRQEHYVVLTDTCSNPKGECQAHLTRHSSNNRARFIANTEVPVECETSLMLYGQRLNISTRVKEDCATTPQSIVGVQRNREENALKSTISEMIPIG